MKDRRPAECPATTRFTDTEVGGDVQYYAAAEVIAATAQTDQDGNFQASLGDVPDGEFAVTAWYAGSDGFWPALGE